MVSDVRGTAQDAQDGAESGYETLAPAVAENQLNLQKGMDALALLAEDVESFVDHEAEDIAARELLSKRIMRCEVYIEVLSRGRFSPASEPIPDSKPAPPSAADAAEAIVEAFEVKPQDVAKKISKKAKNPVPKSLNKAQSYQQQRKTMKCGKGDPLCGL
jgi:hypothetical protein